MKIEMFDENIDADITPFISNGVFDFEDEDIAGGSPFTGDPILFKGDFKFASDVDDEAEIYLVFWNGDEVMEYETILNPNEEWEEFSISVDLDFTPDSVLVVLFGGLESGSIMLYDNMRFVYDDVSLTENGAFNIQSYPNPANEFIHIAINETADLIITDLLGKTVYAQANLNTAVNVNTLDWPNGVYLIQVYKHDKFETQRIVVQH
jgi:hypothetical protein